MTLRLIDTSSLCWRCASKLVSSFKNCSIRTKCVDIKSYNSAVLTKCEEPVPGDLKCSSVFRAESDNKYGLHYDPSLDVSWRFRYGNRTVVCKIQRAGCNQLMMNCRTNSMMLNSVQVLGQQPYCVRKHDFHTSSVHSEKETDFNKLGQTEPSNKLQKLTKEKTSPHFPEEQVLEENGTKTESQTDTSVKLTDKSQMQGNKVANGKEIQDKTGSFDSEPEEVADAINTEKPELSEELPQFDGAKQIKEFLKDNDMVTTQSHTCYITNCPKLGKIVMKRQQKTEGERLFINCTSGHFLCEYCKKSGSWQFLKDNIIALRTVRKKKEYKCFENVGVKEEPQVTPTEVLSLLETAQDIRQLKKEEFEKVINVYDWQGITQSTLARYGAKFTRSDDTYTILLPVKSVKGVVVGVRKFVATQKSADDEEIHTNLRVTSHPRQLTETFGWQSVSPKSSSIVITGSEIESLAIIQKTDVPSIALKNLTYFPQELLPYLERFSKIILWFGNDVKAWQSSKQFAKKLNDLRCHVFRPNSDMLSPLEVIQSEASLKDMLLKARPIGHDSIVSFGKLRHEVYIELAQIEQVAGVKWKRYTPLNKILKGHRPGELTVLTGPTGSGKTTFVADYSLDLCTQGVNTLWGSFEISNVRLAKVMLTQFAGKNMTKNLKKFDETADQFSDIPMFFMTYFGQEEVEKVIEAMSHAVYVHDIRHVVVDNLQFMMGMNYAEGSRFHIQDKIIARFRKFATKMNCHVTLIIHPRKEKDGEELMMASIFGSAKAVQEADNVLILQDMRLTAASGRKYVQVMKNRFDGELGVMMLKFDKESLRFIASQKKSASQKKDEKEEEPVDQNTDSSVKNKKKSGSEEDSNLKFKKLDSIGHSYDDILDIDKYYS